MNKKKANPAKKWLIVLVVVCAAFIVYDFTGGSGWIRSAATGEENDVSQQHNIGDGSENGTASQTEAGVTDEYFATYQTEKEQTRAAELELIEEIIADANAGETVRNEASAKKLSLATNMENELLISALLEAKGLAPSIAFIQDDSVSVVVAAPLDDAAAGQIADIVDGVTGIGYENVVIINKDDAASQQNADTPQE